MPADCIPALASLAKHHANQTSKELENKNQPLSLQLVQSLERMLCYEGHVEQLGLLHCAFRRAVHDIWVHAL
eukprot:1695574-Amphidinium_carterae.1